MEWVRRLWGRRKPRALEESEARYRAVVEASPEGIVVLVEGRIALANPAAARIFGAPSPDALLDVAAADLVSPETAPLIAERNREVEGGGRSAPMQVAGRRLDGSHVDIEVWGLPIEYGGRPADLSVVRDLTDRRRAEREAAQRRAVEADQAVTRELVRRLLHASGGRPWTREVGREMAGEVPHTTLQGYLHALETMGAGRFEVAQSERGRHVVLGRDMLERRPRAAQPTCALPLGYLEGAITRLDGRAALGTETHCQSLGHERCVFVVHAREGGAIVAPARASKRS